MKILHISSYAYGGAGIAAYRIHQSLLDKNIDSSFLCLDAKNHNDLRLTFQFEKPKYSIFQRAVRKVIKLAGTFLGFMHFSPKFYIQYKLKKIKPFLNAEGVGNPFSDYNILDNPLVSNADIIHLHWVSGLLDYKSFFLNNIKPVVWTLHDMNPFLGMFHYKNDEIRNAGLSSKMNKYILDIKFNAINARGCNLSITTPSNWLKKSATQSNVFKNIPAFNIPYPIDTRLFFPSSVKELRTELNIPEMNTVFLFVSQSTGSYRKGFDLLLQAFKYLKHLPISLIVIGIAEDLEIDGLDLKILGSISSNEKLRDYYSLADAFVIPSREDNLPNVMLESMACGTPVLSFDVGGMSEYILDGFNGLKAQKIDVYDLVNILEEFIRTKEKYCSGSIQDFAIKNFAQDLIAEKYIDVYKSISVNNVKAFHNYNQF